MRELEEVHNLVHEEAENLDPRRSPSVAFLNLRNVMITHPTLLENMTWHACNDPLTLFFLVSCKRPLLPGLELYRFLGTAVLADLACIQAQQRIIDMVQRSYIYQIENQAVEKCASLNTETGALAYDLSQLPRHDVPIDVQLVEEEANVIFNTVQELTFPSVEIAELVWWNLAASLAAVLIICTCAHVPISQMHDKVIVLTQRIVDGDFPAKYFHKKFHSHPWLQLTAQTDKAQSAIFKSF